MALPLVKTHYSPLRSLFMMESEEKNVNPTGPQSIALLWKKNKIEDRLHLCEDVPTGFMESYKTLKALEIPFTFSLRLTVCADMAVKDEASLKTEHKIIIMAKNSKGVGDLNKIYTAAATEGFYYIPRTDMKKVEQLWTPNLKLIIPFYDSYLYNNLLTDSFCSLITNIPVAAHLLENNGLPTDAVMNKAVKKRITDAPLVEAQTIYYPDASYFDAYLTMRIIDKKSSMDDPKLRGMCSDEFSLEKWINIS